MTIQITADSTCDLPEEVLRAHKITLIPLGIVMGGRLYSDGVNITTADIDAHVSAGGEISTTSAINAATYAAEFRRLRQSCDAVIHVNLGSGFSSCYQNALLAAEEVPGVFPVDSRNLSVGQGLLVLAAAEAAERGATAAEILTLLETLIPRVEASFVLDRLDYMTKGGRCSAVTALGANLLKLHPCVEVLDGRMGVTKKFRGSMEKAAADYIQRRFIGREDVDTSRAFLVHTARDESLVQAGLRVLEGLDLFDEILLARAGCTIFSHCGPNTISVMFMRKG